jgi:hypothetical protein
MKSRTLVPLRAIGDAAHLGWHPVGTIFEGDEECRQAHGYNPDQLREAQLAYRATSAGIWPEDYQLFRDGVIAGYDMDGNFLPGPNWCEPDPEEDDDE